MATDKINGATIESDNSTILNNGVAVGSITPNAHDSLLSNAFKTAFFAGVTKYRIIPSGVPSAGEISLNGDDMDKATTLLISETDDHGNDLSLMLTLPITGYILHLKDYEGNFGEYTVSSNIDSGGYRTITVNSSVTNSSYTPTGLEGYLSLYTNNTSPTGIYGGSGSLIGPTIVNMGANSLRFSGASNSAQVKDGVITSADPSQELYMDGANKKLAMQGTSVGQGEHNLIFQINPSLVGVDVTLPLENGVILVIPQANTIIANPTASEDGYAIVWDNTAGEYTLAPN